MRTLFHQYCRENWLSFLYRLPDSSSVEEGWEITEGDIDAEDNPGLPHVC